LRESLRNGDEAKLIQIFYDTTELVKFVLAKLIGRVSSLSAVEFFFEHYHQIVAVKNSIGDFDFIEFSDRFMEGFRDELKAILFLQIFMTQMPVVIMVLCMLFLVCYYCLLSRACSINERCIYNYDNSFYCALASFCLVIYTREFVYILFGPLMSGVPAEFGQLLFYLLVLSFLKLLYRQIMIKN
jgi:hypothetical protein